APDPGGQLVRRASAVTLAGDAPSARTVTPRRLEGETGRPGREVDSAPTARGPRHREARTPSRSATLSDTPAAAARFYRDRPASCPSRLWLGRRKPSGDSRITAFTMKKKFAGRSASRRIRYGYHAS